MIGEDVLAQLLTHQGSFIVQYPTPRPNNAHKWFLVSAPKNKWSSSISDEAGEYLVKSGWIAPELSDEEYKIQIALGSVDCRVYRIVPDHLYIEKKKERK